MNSKQNKQNKTNFFEIGARRERVVDEHHRRLFWRTAQLVVERVVQQLFNVVKVCHHACFRMHPRQTMLFAICFFLFFFCYYHVQLDISMLKCRVLIVLHRHNKNLFDPCQPLHRTFFFAEEKSCKISF